MSTRIPFFSPRLHSLLIAAFALVLWLSASPLTLGKDHRGSQFIGLTKFKDFSETWNADKTELVLTSETIRTDIVWDEFVLSWNTDAPTNAQFILEARAVYPERTTKYYTLGVWSSAGGETRHSVDNQNDDDGRVLTDTLRLKAPAQAVQLQITLRGENPSPHWLKLLGLSFHDRSAQPALLPPNTKAWGKVIEVPRRSQLVYGEGDAWCSPTSVSMILNHWAVKLSRMELAVDVPATAAGIHDPNWPGTGNWPFNTAFAGSFTGFRAYVTRFSDVSELEAWVVAGIPVAISVDSNKMHDKPGGPNGHLIVCVGFTETGDIIVNDPGTRFEMRRVFKRENLIQGWGHSKNTVYLIYPEKAKVPKDRFGHWMK